MIRYDSKFQRLALGLACLAGFVDAIGFIKSGGLFVSSMSGNSTRLAIGLVEVSRASLSAATLISLFVLGVFLSSLMAARVTIAHRKVTVMAGVAASLLGAAICQSAGWDIPTIGMLCLAMGAANSIFRRDGEVSIGVTYMTGTLVKLGHRLADAALGGSRTAWAPYLLLWLALVCGGILGAASYSTFPDATVWIAFGFASALVLFTRMLTRDAAV
ncbi:DUF1275 domain-containing protein [Novosphingobium sp. G106]|uniref:YoaK family protein n=1 Tax=Novosphingobium sp. G106 TaxID=2849500 RepID=UPI001C2CD68A|nr:YoaK family protein [Novosphingobium sp. G106]MBV1688376.1 DUF1275 domain-containing protein [Novosphingobium sp. G106]